MSSRIERAYQTARNTVKAEVRDGAVVWRPRGRLENFLTELVALAALDDWGPIEAILRDSGIIDGPAPIDRIRPYTQQAIWESDRKKRRAVDLVLILERGDTEAEVWLEVKAGAGFHGDQMELYLDAIHSAADSAACAERPEDATWRRLAVLAPTGTQVPHKHRDGEPVGLITWDQLADAARAPSASRLWHEVASFLVEQRVTTQSAAAARPPDVPAVADVEWLAEALAVALGPGVPRAWLAWTHAHSRELRSRSLRQVLDRLQAKSEPLEVFRQGPRGGLVAVRLGFAQGTTALRVQLWLTADYFVPHRVLRRRAVAAGMSNRGWQLGDRDDSVILGIVDPAMRPGGATPDTAGAWLRAQLAALEAESLLLDLDGNGNLAAAIGPVASVPMPADTAPSSDGR